MPRHSVERSNASSVRAWRMQHLAITVLEQVHS